MTKYEAGDVYRYIGEYEDSECRGCILMITGEYNWKGDRDEPRWSTFSISNECVRSGSHGNGSCCALDGTEKMVKIS